MNNVFIVNKQEIHMQLFTVYQQHLTRSESYEYILCKHTPTGNESFILRH